MMRIIVPMSPPAGLTSNRRRKAHWSKQYDAGEELKKSVKYESGVEVPGTPIGPYTVEVKVVWEAGKVLWPDIDNLPPAIKPAFDQLQNMGVIENDSLCQRYTITQEEDPRGGAIVIDITPV